MAREIDFSQPLSDEDRQYLLDRGKEQLLQRLDASGGDLAQAQRALASYVPGTEVDRAEGVPPTPGGDPTVVMGGGDVAPPEDEEHELSGDAVMQTAETEDDYDSWTKEELAEEAENRELPRSGSKADLIRRLREDDES